MEICLCTVVEVVGIAGPSSQWKTVQKGLEMLSASWQVSLQLFNLTCTKMLSVELGISKDLWNS